MIKLNIKEKDHDEDRPQYEEWLINTATFLLSCKFCVQDYFKWKMIFFQIIEKNKTRTSNKYYNNIIKNSMYSIITE